MNKKYKLSSFDLKLALMEKYRFQQQQIVAEECNDCDILSDNGKIITEIEVKMSKSDLKAEDNKRLFRKPKHVLYANSKAWIVPNKFYFCVPSYMTEFTIEYAKSLNSKYGVIEFDDKKFLDKLPNKRYSNHGTFVRVVKRAGKLHDKYSLKYARMVALRACTKSISLMQNVYKSKLLRIIG